MTIPKKVQGRMKGLWKQLLIDGADDEFVYKMKNEYKRCLKAARQNKWKASLKASPKASPEASLIPSPLISPDEKESSKGKVNPSIIPPTETTTTTRACACEGENHTTGPKAQKPKDAEPRERMKTPSIEECREYHAAKKYSWEIESFYDYYTANGWKVGRNPMKDWRAAMRNWNRTEKNKTSGGTSAGYYRRRADNDQRPTAEQVKDIMEVL